MALLLLCADLSIDYYLAGQGGLAASFSITILLTATEAFIFPCFRMPLAHLAEYLARAIMVVICRFYPPSDADLAVIVLVDQVQERL